MVKYFFQLKDFLVDMFSQNENIGLKSIEQVKTITEPTIIRKDSDFKFSDIMK